MNAGDKKSYLPGRVSLVATVARASLGIVYNEYFNAELHSEDDKYWDDNEGRWFARDQMTWFLRKVRKI